MRLSFEVARIRTQVTRNRTKMISVHGCVREAQQRLSRTLWQLASSMSLSFVLGCIRVCTGTSRFAEISLPQGDGAPAVRSRGVRRQSASAFGACNTRDDKPKSIVRMCCSVGTRRSVIFPSVLFQDVQNHSNYAFRHRLVPLHP